MQPVPRAQTPSSAPAADQAEGGPTSNPSRHASLGATIGSLLPRVRAWLLPLATGARQALVRARQLLAAFAAFARQPFWLEGAAYLLVVAAVLFVFYAGTRDARFLAQSSPSAPLAGLDPVSVLVSALTPLIPSVPWPALLRLCLAGWFGYGLLRGLGAGRFGALIGAESLALGSLLVAYAGRPSLAELAVWLPAVLLFGHGALAGYGYRRLLSIFAGGAAFGLASLSVAPGGMLLILLVLWAYLAFLWVTGPIGRSPTTAQLLQPDEVPDWQPRWLATIARAALGAGLTQAHRFAAVLLVAIAVPTIGLAFAAPRSPLIYAVWFDQPGLTRPAGVPTLAGVLQLVLPFFFRAPDGEWWGFWPLAETALYVGLAPLCFALFAIALARRRETLFFALLVVASLVAAFGLIERAPAPLAMALTTALDRVGLPGASFALGAFALAVLAGLGADGVERRLARGTQRPSLFVGLLVACPFLLTFALMVALAWGARWLDAAWTTALDFIGQHYLPLGGTVGSQLDPIQLYVPIAESINPLAPATLWSGIVLLVSGLLLLGRVQVPRLRSVWCFAMLVVVAADLAVYGQFFALPTMAAAPGLPGGPSLQVVEARPAAADGLVLASQPAGRVGRGSSLVPDVSVIAQSSTGVTTASFPGPLGLLTAAVGLLLVGVWATLLPGALVSEPSRSSAPRAWPLRAPAWPWEGRRLVLPGRLQTGRWGELLERATTAGLHGAWWLLRALGRGIRVLVGWPIWMDLACLASILGVAIAFVWPMLSRGEIFYEYDTRHYYYPVLTELQRALSEGRLPLWTPRIFGGFPLFAEGETGSLYPFKLLALQFVPPEQALGWVGLGNFIVAGWGMYFFGRALGLSRVASLIGGFSFQCSSFIVGQFHHASLHSSAVWLPWILAGAERAIRLTGLYRLTAASIGGGALAMACLGLHPQPVLISVTFVAIYVVWRLLTGPFGFNWPFAWPGPWYVAGNLRLSLLRLLRNVAHLFAREMTAAGSRLLQIGIILGALFGAGFGIASIQLLPLLELAAGSIRQGGVEYAFASTYSMPTFHLAQLLLPYGFRTDLGTWWTLWAPWETSLYAGVGTLILALMAVLLVRSRLVLFFAAATVASLLIAFGEYAPIRLHEMLYQLPGFGSLRVPGRFGLVALFSICVLAMLGADWLDRRFCSVPTRRFHSLDRVLTAVVVWLMAALAAALPAALWWARRWLIEHPDEALAFIKADYLGLRRGNTELFSAPQVYQYLLDTLDPLDERTMLSLLLFGGVALSLVIWWAAPHWRHLWRIGLLGVVAIDAVAFATAYHDVRPIEEITRPEEAEAWVAERAGTDRVAVLPHGKDTQSAALLPLGVYDIGGYSSLDPQRVAAFKDWMVKEGTELLNLGTIRYLIVPNEPNPTPSYENVSVRPQWPLAQGKRENPNSRAVFVVEPFYTDSVRVISGLFDAIDVTNGEPVAEIVVSTSAGEQQRLVMLAGQHTAEWAYDRPDVRDLVQHDRPKSAFKQPQSDPDGRRYEVDYFYAELPLTKPMMVERIEFRNIHPEAGIRLFGIALWDLSTYTSDTMTWERKAQFQRVFETERSIVYENLDAYPKTRIVRQAVPAPIDMLGLYTLANESFDPRRMTYINAPETFWQEYDAATERIVAETDAEAAEAELGEAASTAATLEDLGDGMVWPDRSWVTDYGDERVEIVTEAEEPGFLVLHDTYLPGWKAFVDGVEVPIYRADYLYRAVAIPAGRHTVEFRYEPESVALGGLLTMIAAGGVALLWLYTFVLRPLLVLLFRGLRWLVRRGARALYLGRIHGWPRAKRLWRWWVHSNELPTPRLPDQ